MKSSLATRTSRNGPGDVEVVMHSAVIDWAVDPGTWRENAPSDSVVPVASVVAPAIILTVAKRMGRAGRFPVNPLRLNSRS